MICNFVPLLNKIGLSSFIAGVFHNRARILYFDQYSTYAFPNILNKAPLRKDWNINVFTFKRIRRPIYLIIQQLYDIINLISQINISGCFIHQYCRIPEPVKFLLISHQVYKRLVTITVVRKTVAFVNWYWVMTIDFSTESQKINDC